MEDLLAAPLIRDVPDFPKPGILFKDITPVLQDPAAFQQIVDIFADYARGLQADVAVGIESRGFVFGAPVALNLKSPFVLIRKRGKLPHSTYFEEYALEYGTNVMEVHTDAIRPGQRVVIVDDLLATGGTAAASARLVERLGGIVAGFAFMVELGFLKGREALVPYDVRSLITY